MECGPPRHGSSVFWWLLVEVVAEMQKKARVNWLEKIALVLREVKNEYNIVVSSGEKESGKISGALTVVD